MSIRIRLGTAIVAALLATTASGCSLLPATPSAGTHTSAKEAATKHRVAAVAVDDLHFFNASSPWNQRADTMPAAPQWQNLLRQAGERVAGVGGVSPTTLQRQSDDRLFINTDAWTVPVVSGGVPTKLVCRQVTCDVGSEPITLDVPADTSPDPRYDGWFTIVDQAHDIAYDLWRARRETDGTISYQYVRTWALDGSGYGSPGQPSARGSGLPLFAGLIMGGELQRGQIDHALAISIPGAAANNFVRPASMTDGNGQSSSLPEGARIRLRPGVSWQTPRDPVTGQPIPLTSQQRRAADAVMQALRTYGAIVVDRSAVPALYAEKGIGSAYLNGSSLQGLTLDDFQVVGLGQRYQYPIEKTATGDITTVTSSTSIGRSAVAGTTAPTSGSGSGAGTGTVTVAGTSDRLTAAELRRYRADGNDVQASYGGTSAGFDALCAGNADLVDSATPISAKQLAACHDAGLDVVQFQLAADAVVVATRNESDIGGDCLSTDQTRDIFRAGSPYTNWSQLGFANVPLSVAGPGPDADDFQVFATNVLGSVRPELTDMRFDYAHQRSDDGTRVWSSGQPGWQLEAAQAPGLQAALAAVRDQLAEQQQKYESASQALAYARSALTADTQLGAGAAQVAADQKAVFTAQGQMQGAQTWIATFRQQVAAAKAAYDVAAGAQRRIDGLRGRIAVYGFPYYQLYEDHLRPMEITLPGRRNCVFPNQQTIMDGEYPLARRMLLTTTTSAMQRPEVADLLSFVLSRVRADAAAADLVAVDQATLDRQQSWVQGSATPVTLAGKATASAAPEVPAQ